MTRLVELAQTISVIKAEGTEAVDRAYTFRRWTCEEVGFTAPPDYMTPDGLDNDARYYFAIAPNGSLTPQPNDGVLAVVRTVLTNPMADLKHTEIDLRWQPELARLQSGKQLASISRLLTVRGITGMAACLALYRELATDAFGSYSHYVCEAVPTLQDRLRFLGFEAEAVGPRVRITSVEDLTARPLLVDVAAGVRRLSQRDDEVSNFMLANLELDLRSPAPLASIGMNQ